MLSLFWSVLLLGGAAVASDNVDYATSTPDIDTMLQIEDELIEYMRQYVLELKQKVDRMRKVQEEWKTRREQVETDAENYVANPLISFPLILRLHVDAPKWLELGCQDIQKNNLHINKT